jgi:hypothetical protein
MGSGGKQAAALDLAGIEPVRAKVKPSTDASVRVARPVVLRGGVRAGGEHATLGLPTLGRETPASKLTETAKPEPSIGATGGTSTP